MLYARSLVVMQGARLVKALNGDCPSFENVDMELPVGCCPVLGFHSLLVVEQFIN